MDKGLGKRLFDFSVKVICYSRKLPKSKEYDILKSQLIKSATSCGANYEEAQGAFTKPDFYNKINIALKEIREANYWIRILIEINNVNEDLILLKQESDELKLILGSISSKSNKRIN
jgi:four helix bundle protein